jgi:hypothetical protein
MHLHINLLAPISIQVPSNPIRQQNRKLLQKDELYCTALFDELAIIGQGTHRVHRHVGVEPSKNVGGGGHFLFHLHPLNLVIFLAE